MKDILGLSHVQWYAIFFLLIGIMLNLIADRSGYYRRRSESTTGYFKYQTRTLAEKLLKAVGNLSIYASLFLFFIEYNNRYHSH